MTSTAETPVQLLLPGQAAAPDGPIDLDAFADAARRTPVADRERWARLSRRFGLFADVLHKHHHGEDVGLWPLLHERGADPAVLDALEAEHEGIDPLLSGCRSGLAAMADGTGDETTRAQLVEHTAQLRDGLSAHLAHEERDGMALVQAYLTPEDWTRLDKEVFAKDYRPREIPAVLGWVMSGLPADAARRLPGANPVFLAFGRLLARRFDRSEARTFGA